MILINSKNRFSSVTKLFHWIIFFLFVIQYFLVYRREYFPKGSAEKLQYILLHKSIGVVLLGIAFLLLVFRNIGTRPAMPTTMSQIEIKLAKFTHFLLYIVMFLQPMTGILMSDFSGKQISVFAWFELPLLFGKNEIFGNICYQMHVWVSYFIIGIVSLHILGALYHYLIKKDRILQRMLPERSSYGY